MKKLVQIWLGMIIFVLSLWTPVYLFIVDSGEDRVEKISLSDVLFTSQLMRCESKRERDEREKLVNDFTSSYEDKFGVDISESIYNILDDDDKVTNLEIKKLQEFEQECIYVIQFIRDNKRYAIEIAAVDPSFLNPKWGPTVVLSKLGAVLKAVAPSYGIHNSHISEIVGIFGVGF